jgi:hypothetical protein
LDAHQLVSDEDVAEGLILSRYIVPITLGVASHEQDFSLAPSSAKSKMYALYFLGEQTHVAKTLQS